tara:strand:- start:260248 stop:261342 length:1095 start_codon:yes stop_codon:yes gene_type:complete
MSDKNRNFFFGFVFALPLLSKKQKEKGERMKWFLSLILMVNISLAQNNNLGEAITSLLKKTGFIDFMSDKGECPETFEHLPEQDAQALISRAFELRSKSKYCESARYFYELRRQWPVKEYYKMAWRELVNSYVLADDLIAAINEGNDFMAFFVGTPDVEEVHLILLNAVYIKMMAAGSEKSQEWTEYALGISKEQNSDNPYLKNLSFKDYLDKYPNTKNRQLIEGMMRYARNNHAEYHLKIGNYYASRMMPDASFPNYPAAIGRYATVLRWGPIVSSYNQTLFSTVDALYKMSAIIESNTISEDKLKEWLQIDPNGDKKAVDRKSIVEQIRAQIAELQKKMNSETITQDIWIQKTRSLIEEKQK